MTVYIFLLLGTVLLGIPLCSPKCGKAGRMIYCIGLAVVFIFIAAMRFQVGYDFNLYGGTYFNMKYMDVEEISMNRMEKGFLMPLYVLNLAFEDYRTVFIYTSVIIYSAVFYLIGKNSSNPWISAAAYLCFGLFFNSLCFLRQTMAALIAAYAVKYIDEKRPLRFFVLIIAASAFHWSALIMLAMFFLLKIKPGRIYLGIVTAGTVICCIFSKQLMFWVIDKFYMYKGYNPETNAEAIYGLPIRYTIMFGVLFAVCFVFRKRLIEKNSRNAVYLNCLMYTVVFEALGTRHGVLSRFALLVYIPPILYLVPDLADVIKEYISEKFTVGMRRQAVNICSAAAGFVFSVGCYFMLMLSNYNGTVPYVSQIDRPNDIFVEQISDEDDEADWFDDEEDWDDEDWDEEDWDDEEWNEEEFEDEILDQLS
ncbi:MAG: EpsG family protein [Oscillospiraceae bacterium]